MQRQEVNYEPLLRYPNDAAKLSLFYQISALISLLTFTIVLLDQVFNFIHYNIIILSVTSRLMSVSWVPAISIGKLSPVSLLITLEKISPPL